MSDEKLVETAREALGGTEEVLAAGIFHPRGTTGGRVGATAAGFSTDNIVGEVAGVAAGAMAGHVAAEARDVPLRTILAVTPTHVDAFVAEADGVHWKAGERFATFDRTKIQATVHARVNVHTLTIVDPETGRTYEWEGNRIGPDHANAVIHAMEVDVTEEPGA
ncbi:MAG: hypothetical protein ACXWXS_01545 [Actinomycetota bacterium]